MKKIISNLFNELISHGFIHSAMDVYQILSELEDEENEECDVSSVVNIVGLRGDTKPEEPIGGMTVSPFFFDTGDPF